MDGRFCGTGWVIVTGLANRWGLSGVFFDVWVLEFVVFFWYREMTGSVTGVIRASGKAVPKIRGINPFGISLPESKFIAAPSSGSILGSFVSLSSTPDSERILFYSNPSRICRHRLPNRKELH